MSSTLETKTPRPLRIHPDKIKPIEVSEAEWHEHDPSGSFLGAGEPPPKIGGEPPPKVG